jgi:CheY-like chemotaxis protein
VSPTILIADDDGISQLLGDSSSGRPCGPRCGADGGTELFADEIDIVLLDIVMPSSTASVLERLKATPE